MYRYILRYKLLRLNYRFGQVTYKIVTNIVNGVIPMRKYEMAFNLLQWINFNCSQLTYADASFIGSFENFVCRKFSFAKSYFVWRHNLHCIVSNGPEQENTGTAYILDGMAIVQVMKAGGAQSFGKLAEKYYQYITSLFQQPGCNRVDVVFDRYNKPYSIKGNERECRGASLAPNITIL